MQYLSKEFHIGVSQEPANDVEGNLFLGDEDDIANYWRYYPCLTITYDRKDKRAIHPHTTDYVKTYYVKITAYRRHFTIAGSRSLEQSKRFLFNEDRLRELR